MPFIKSLSVVLILNTCVKCDLERLIIEFNGLSIEKKLWRLAMSEKLLYFTYQYQTGDNDLCKRDYFYSPHLHNGAYHKSDWSQDGVKRQDTCDVYEVIGCYSNLITNYDKKWKAENIADIVKLNVFLMHCFHNKILSKICQYNKVFITMNSLACDQCTILYTVKEEHLR